MKRNNNIDFFKGVAIVLIVCAHSGVQVLPGAVGMVAKTSANAVQLFLIISAMLSYKSYVSYMEKRDKKSDRLWMILNWLLKKAMRLIPLYYLALLVGITFGGQSYWLGAGRTITIGNVLAHMVLLHGLNPFYMNSIIGVEWYLGVLWIFYLLVPILHKIVTSFEKAILFFIFCSVACVGINHVILGYIHPENASDAILFSSYFGTYSFLQQFPVLLLGIIMYFGVIDGKYKKGTKIRSMVWSVSGVVLLGGLVLQRNQLLGYNTYTLYGFAFAMLLWSQFIYPNKICENRIFVFLGQHSYTIYLFHFFAISCIRTSVDLLTVNEYIKIVIKIFFALSTTSLLSLGVDYMSVMLKKRISRMKER